MILDAFASAPHYLNHLASIWRALPSSLRGTFYTTNASWPQAKAESIEYQQSRVPMNGPPILVASYADYRSASRRQVIFVEHGAGQSYSSRPDYSSYSGGKGRDRVILFICPNETVATRNRNRYPHIPTAIIGCPRLDALHSTNTIPRPRSNPPIIAFTFHANYDVVPETTSGYRHFHPAIPLVKAAGYHVIGHAHPRIYRRLVSLYARYGVEMVANPDDVLRRADILCVDNSSLGFEAASLGIPLVWLSPPQYRRDVQSWPRFWDALCLGEEATTAEEVPAAVTRALQPIPSDVQQTRDQFISTVYAHSGDSSERAAEAIMRLMAERQEMAGATSS